MARNNAWGWVVAESIASGDAGYSPREVKATAMVLTILGHSSRQIERELRRKFPGRKIPPWTTIARWQRSRPMNRTAVLKWMDVAMRASELMLKYLDEIEANSMSLKEMMSLYDMSHRAYDISLNYAVTFR